MLGFRVRVRVTFLFYPLFFVLWCLALLVCSDGWMDRVGYMSFQELKESGLAPNGSTYKALLGALAKEVRRASSSSTRRQALLREAFAVFNGIRAAASKVAVDADMYHAMVSMCATCGRADAALALYGQMKEEEAAGHHLMESVDVELFNSMLSACKKAGAPGEMRAVLDGMVERGIKPNLRSYNEMISACKKAGSPQDALAIWDDMTALGIAGDAVTYSALIAACDVAAPATGSGVDLYLKGVALLQDMKKAGVRPTVHAYTALISMCGKRGRVDDGYAFFDEMKASGVALDVNSYNVLMSFCARNRDMEKAQALLKEMKEDAALKPDQTSFTTLITAYAQDSATWRQENPTNTPFGSPRQKSNMLAAFALLNDMKELGLKPNLTIYKALIDLSLKSGRFDRVKHTIHLMKNTSRYKAWLSRNYPRD